MLKPKVDLQAHLKAAPANATPKLLKEFGSETPRLHSLLPNTCFLPVLNLHEN
jgi:hypothetical protein